MHRYFRIVAAAAMLAVAATSPAGAGEESTEALQLAIVSAAKLVDRNQGDAARDRIDAVLADPAFGKLPADTRAAAFAVSGLIELQRDQAEDALGPLGMALTLNAEAGDVWYWQSLAQRAAGDAEAAATSLAHVVRSWPQYIDLIDEFHIPMVLHEADKFSAPRIDLLQALFDTGWTRFGLGASPYWYELALARLATDEPELAAAAVARVTTPREIILMRVDRRFDGLLDLEAPQFDVLEAAQRDMDQLRVHALLEGHSLRTLIELGEATLLAGRNADVVAMTSQVIDQLEDPAGAAAFPDAWRAPWLFDLRSRALRRQGQMDEAVASLRQATALEEFGGANVSQVLNLASLLIGLERPDEALEVMAAVGAMSGYGQMMREVLRLAAAVQLGDAETVEASLGALQAGREDAPIALLGGLMYAGRSDEAATWLIELLESAEKRELALWFMQELRKPDTLPGDAPLEERRHELLARQDVLAVAHRVGRIERFDIHR